MPEPSKTSSSSIDWRRLHLWEIQPVRDLLLIAAIIALIYVGYVISIVTVPMLLALLLAYLFEPFVRFLRRKRVCSRRTAAIGIIVVFAVLVVAPLAIGTTYAIIRGSEAVSVLATNIAKIEKSVESPDDAELKAAVPSGAWMRIRDFLAERPKPPEGLKEGEVDLTIKEPAEELRETGRRVVAWIQAHGAEISKTVGGRVIGSGAQAVTAAVGTVTSIGFMLFTGLLTAFFFYFFSTSWGKVLEFWENLIPEHRRGRVVHIVSQMDRAIAGFVRGRITIACIMMVYLVIGYTIIGVPWSFVLGIVIGALWIVPYLPGIGMPIAMLLMWFSAPATGLHSHWWWIVFAPVGVHLLAQPLDDYFLTPKIQGKATELSLPTILFASLAGGALAGVYGLLIAIPIAACLRILLKEVFWPRFRQWAEGKRSDFLPIGKD